MNSNEKENVAEEIESLRELVVKLHARVDFLESKTQERLDALEKRHERAAKIAYEYDLELKRYCDMLSTDSNDAFGRIKNLELKVFPHLAADLDELHKVIGETENQPECPQERRKP